MSLARWSKAYCHSQSTTCTTPWSLASSCLLLLFNSTNCSKLAEVDPALGLAADATLAANTAAGRANTIAGTLEGIAPKWSAVDISASGLAAGAAPTASVTQDVGGTHLTVGIPKGDKGDKGDTGNVMYATFDIIDGELIVTTPDGYTGPTFSIVNNELEVSI